VAVWFGSSYRHHPHLPRRYSGAAHG
jgi:hypothetical protein